MRLSLLGRPTPLLTAARRCLIGRETPVPTWIVGMVKTDFWSSEHGRKRHVAIPAAFLAIFLGVTTTVAAQSEPPTLSKIFSPATIGPGSVSTLTFTIFETPNGRIEMKNAF